MAKIFKSKKDTVAFEMGARLRNFIDIYYITNTKFAETCSMNISQLSEYLNGVMPVSDRIANKMQDKAGLSKDYLMN